jgi:hypothetical protein
MSIGPASISVAIPLINTVINPVAPPPYP